MALAVPPLSLRQALRRAHVVLQRASFFPSEKVQVKCFIDLSSSLVCRMPCYDSFLDPPPPETPFRRISCYKKQDYVLIFLVGSYMGVFAMALHW
jgi:hypothetical protein